MTRSRPAATLSAIANRGEARDFWDLHAIVGATGRSLDELLAVFQARHPRVDTGHPLRSLVYFGNATRLPVGLTAEHWARVRTDLETWVKALVLPP